MYLNFQFSLLGYRKVIDFLYIDFLATILLESLSRCSFFIASLGVPV